MNENKSINSLKKQLVAAVAMVLVAAVALGSSTYAWFAANNKVTAQGMQVQAKTEGGIEIAFGKSTDSNGTFGTTATAGMTASPALLPTSTLGTATNSAITSGWYHASAEAGSASTAKINTRSTLDLSAGSADKFIAGSNTEKQDTTQFYDSNGDQYYLIKNFTIRSTSSSVLAKALKVDKVSVTGTSYDMNNALRVAVVVGNKTLFYAPVGQMGVTDADTNTDGIQYAVYSGYTGDGTQDNPYKAIEAGKITLTEANTSTLIGGEETTIPAKGSNMTNGGVDVSVYIYFEGEDTRLFSQNFNTDTLVVTVDFSATV